MADQIHLEEAGFGILPLTEGAWMGIKMSQWKLMPVLDIDTIDNSQLSELATLFDQFENKDLKRLMEQYRMNGDIDQNRLLLDFTFLEIMGISVTKDELLGFYKHVGSSLKQWIA